MCSWEHFNTPRVFHQHQVFTHDVFNSPQMKTVGERIQQARKFRGLSGEELALEVGYKTQSGISNLENRWTGKGGFRLPAIAKVLNFSLQWFLEGPDTDDMSTVPAYEAQATHKTAEPEARYNTARGRAHQLIDGLNDAGVFKAIEYLELISDKYSQEQNNSAGVFVPARALKTA